MEILIVVIILGILTAFAVPVFSASMKKQRQNECANQRTVISTAVKQVMSGMVDNGKKQDVISFKTTDVKKEDTNNPDKVTTYTEITDCSVSDPSVTSQKHFKLTDDETCFTIGDIRGGYRHSDNYDYDEGCDQGHYLKKLALADDEFYKYLQNGDMPVCPFDDEDNPQYFYYVLADGSVLCSCPECNEAD